LHLLASWRSTTCSKFHRHTDCNSLLQLPQNPHLMSAASTAMAAHLAQCVPWLAEPVDVAEPTQQHAHSQNGQVNLQQQHRDSLSA
jgi:hypothetical protein